MAPGGGMPAPSSPVTAVRTRPAGCRKEYTASRTPAGGEGPVAGRPETWSLPGKSASTGFCVGSIVRRELAMPAGGINGKPATAAFDGGIDASLSGCRTSARQRVAVSDPLRRGRAGRCARSGGCPVPATAWALRHPVVAVECGDPVRLGHGWVVEGGVDEVEQAVRLTLLRHDRLTDVDDLGSLIPEAVNAEQFQGFGVEQQLQHAGGLAGNLGAGEVLEEVMADLVRDLGGRQLPLGLADRTDLRNSVLAGRDIPPKAHVALVLGDMGGGDAALVVGGAGQARVADHVAHRIDVRLRGLVVLVDGD